MSWPGRRPAPGFTTRVPDFEAFFEALPAPCIVFAADDPRYTIVAVNEAYLRATNSVRYGARGLLGDRCSRPFRIRCTIRGDRDREHADLAAPRDAAPRPGPDERAALPFATAGRHGGGAALEPRERAGAGRRRRGGVHRPPRRGRDEPARRAGDAIVADPTARAAAEDLTFGAQGAASFVDLAFAQAPVAIAVLRGRDLVFACCNRAYGALRATARSSAVDSRGVSRLDVETIYGSCDEVYATRDAVRRERFPVHGEGPGTGDLLQLRVSAAHRRRGRVDGHRRLATDVTELVLERLVAERDRVEADVARDAAEEASRDEVEDARDAEPRDAHAAQRDRRLHAAPRRRRARAGDAGAARGPRSASARASSISPAW